MKWLACSILQEGQGDKGVDNLGFDMQLDRTLGFGDVCGWDGRWWLGGYARIGGGKQAQV